jgi:hypothetical protein
MFLQPGLAFLGGHRLELFEGLTEFRVLLEEFVAAVAVALSRSVLAGGFVAFWDRLGERGREDEGEEGETEG